MNLIKSPLNYSGNKYRMLEELLEVFGGGISTFLDVFGGGGTVGVNVKATKIIYNDSISHIPRMYQAIQELGAEKAFELVNGVVEEYELSKTNEKGFLKLREDYNNGKNKWYHLYALITNSFNYQLRFNQSGGYNSSFGRNRSHFNPRLKKRFKLFSKRINNLNIQFLNKDFRELDYSKLKKGDVVYLDPPYFLGNAVYQDSAKKGKGWSLQDDLDLFDVCDKLNEEGVKFVMSNAFRLKGKEHKTLIKWAGKYNTKFPKVQYLNCSYHKIDKETKDVEVIVYN